MLDFALATALGIKKGNQENKGIGDAHSLSQIVSIAEEEGEHLSLFGADAINFLKDQLTAANSASNDVQ